MNRNRMILAAASGLLAAFIGQGAGAADPVRGKALYESRCASCHAQSVHGRVNRVAVDFADVRRWTTRWAETLSLGWRDEELDDVAVYLNGAFYRYPCPPSACKVVSFNAPTR